MKSADNLFDKHRLPRNWQDMRKKTRFVAPDRVSFDTTHNLKVTGSNPVPATKNTRLIKDFKAEHNARLLSFQILVNTWSTFEEAPLRGGLLRSETRVSRQDHPGTDPFGASARGGSSRYRCRRSIAAASTRNDARA